MLCRKTIVGLWAMAVLSFSPLVAPADSIHELLLTDSKPDPELLGSWSIVELRDDNLNQNSRLGLPRETDDSDPKRRVTLTFRGDGMVTVVNAQGKRVEGGISFTDFTMARTDPRAPRPCELTWLPGG